MRKLLITATLLAFALPALAHAPKPKHGGRVALAGDFHAELVAKENAIEVHLIDHDDKMIKVNGYKGVAILTIDGKSERIVLEPVGDDRLSGKSGAALPTQPKGVVQITPPNGKVVSARFN